MEDHYRIKKAFIGRNWKECFLEKRKRMGGSGQRAN
jgi:hypothetical protein